MLPELVCIHEKLSTVPPLLLMMMQASSPTPADVSALTHTWYNTQLLLYFEYSSAVASLAGESFWLLTILVRM